MMTTVLMVLIATSPIWFVVGLLWLAERRSEGLARRVALQIQVTDAVHRELGAVAAPEVAARPGGGWRVRLRVPGRPALIGPLVQIVERSMERASPRPFEIVLLPPMPEPTSARGGRLATRLAAATR
jgi:hypothetical protein